MPLSTTPTNDLTFSVQGQLALAGAEISAFDPGSDRLYVTSSTGLQVVDLSDPSAPSLITTIDFTAAGYGYATTDVTSVAIRNGIVAVALPAANKSDPGTVVFLNAATGARLGDAQVGALPDNVVFTPDGNRVLVANEGEYLNGNGGPGTAEGSVSIIDISAGAGAATVTTAGFGAFNGQEAALRAEGVRIFQGQSASRDLEPEYIAVNAAGTQAVVTLQEANAVGLLDLGTGAFTDIVALGTKDFSTLLADFSDRDGPGAGNAVNLETGNPVSGLFMPDGIDSYAAGGQTYYVIANEGDDRNDFLNPDEVIRLGNASYDLDNTAFPNEAALKADAELGRLNVVNTPGLRGDTDGDGDIDQILTLGARSFSILDSAGSIVFDSADILERISAELVANGQLSLADFDDRSDNKGPEPESIEIATIGDATYAFVGLERANATLAFDITDPNDPTYTGLLKRAGDVAPEGGLFISATDSPTGEALYVTSNEASNNITVFGVEPPPYRLQILHASDFEAGTEAVQRAPNFAAIVDALEDTYANSITLSSGDNFIPGPFTAAGTDPSVRDEVAGFYEQLLGLPANSLTGIRNGTLPFNAADIAILNAIGIQSSALGNHEFDLGPTALAGAFDFTPNNAASLAAITNIGAQFPYLSANLDFSAEPALAGLFTSALRDAASYATTASDLASPAAITAEASDRQVAPWTTITEGGETIGIIGATTQILETISTTGGVEVIGPDANDMQALADILQPYIDQMTAQGIDKIILTSHLQQIGLERQLAGLLSGVDIILGGGSNTIFADGTDRLSPGDTAGGTYPEFIDDASGGRTALVNTDGNYNYVGRLVIDFDAQGRIVESSVDPAISGAYVTDDEGVDAVAGNGDGTLSQAERDAIFADGTRGGEVKQIADAIGTVIAAKDGNVVGFTDVFLEGRRNEVRTEETNLGSLTADANLAVAKATDLTTVISIKNGGGIRAEIGVVEGEPIPQELPPQANPAAGKPEGGVSQLDIENSLRFNNALSLITLDAQGILNAVENALRSTAPGATPGSFPQIAGLEFSFDATRASLDRVINLNVVDQSGQVIDVIARDGALVGDGAREFRVVTLNFLADGGDGIIVRPGQTAGTLPVYNTVAELNRVDLFSGTDTSFNAAGREQSALANYLSALNGTPADAFDDADTTPANDERIQNLAARSDTIGNTVESVGQDDVVVGTSRNNTVSTGLGDDRVFLGGGLDRADGGRGNDLLVGGADLDRLTGGQGNDTLLGGEGADRLRGNTGNDVLTGGEGRDIFFFQLGNDTGTDTVTDFLTRVDRVDLIGYGFSFADVQARLSQQGSDTFLSLSAETTVILEDVLATSLVARDFILA